VSAGHSTRDARGADARARGHAGGGHAGGGDAATGPAPDAEVELAELAPGEYDAAIPVLAALLADAVDSGGSMNFVKPFSADEAAAWWSTRTADVAAGSIRPVVARLGGEIVGCALLMPSRNPNAQHRAEVGKVMVHRRARGRGVAGRLMAAVEDLARRDGRWLLLLDTRSGTTADRMYRRLGWVAFGEVPNHALTSDGVLSDTTYFYKDLRR
jgi:GNAT superfamily N-acetyltransferase